jgi:hypothetical protein
MASTTFPQTGGFTSVKIASRAVITTGLIEAAFLGRNTGADSRNFSQIGIAGSFFPNTRKFSLNSSQILKKYHGLKIAAMLPIPFP